jgi:DNA helicase II / ATP-dependent DNA helicase PcrA
VIAANESRLGKTLWTDLDAGEKVRLIGHWDGEEEARWIGEEIEALARGTRGLDPVSPDGMAILVRASFQMRAFEDRFLTIGLPYRVIGGPRFYERAEIRDAMAYFRLAVSPDDDLAFERIVNVPKRGIGDKALQEINRAARAHDLNLLEAARRMAEGGLPARPRAALGELVAGFDRWHASIRAGDVPHVALAETILDESGYTAMWQADRTPEAPGRLENLKELVKALDEFENLQGFLEHVSLVMDNATEDAAPKVSIMTLHAAKGLEFPAVFLPGWEDGLFPSQRSMDESGLKGLEEERRLAYVGITRAERLCTISFAANRRVYNQWQSALPSRFIDELPAAHVEVLTPPGLYGGGFGAAAPRAEPASAPVSTLADTAARADVYNSPGWKRLQARAGTRPIAQPKEARTMTIDATATAAFEPGTRVFHQKFGYGTVEAVEGDKLAVAFDKAGTKNVVARFVTAADEAVLRAAGRGRSRLADTGARLQARRHGPAAASLAYSGQNGAVRHHGHSTFRAGAAAWPQAGTLAHDGPRDGCRHGARPRGDGHGHRQHPDARGRGRGSGHRRAGAGASRRGRRRAPLRAATRHELPHGDQGLPPAGRDADRGALQL